MSLDPNIALTLRAAIALLFAAALAHKLRHAGEFERTLGRYLQGIGLAGLPLGKPLLVAVIVLEAFVVVACLTPSMGAIGGIAASSTLLLYAAAMGLNLLRGNTRMDCGCGWGPSRATIRPALVLRNVLLAIVALAIVLPGTDRALSVLDIASVVIATLTVALLYAAGERLLAITGPQPGRIP